MTILRADDSQASGQSAVPTQASRLEILEKKIGDFEKSFGVHEKLINDSRTDLDTLRKESVKMIDERQTTSIELIGIFATLFTFVSVNISIFSKITNLSEAILFMVLMACTSIALLAALIAIVSSGCKKVFGILVTVAFGYAIWQFVINEQGMFKFNPMVSRIGCIQDCRAK